MTSWLRTFVMLAAAASLGSCASKLPESAADAASSASVQQRPEPLRPLYARLGTEGHRNEVLNRMEIGTMAFFYGDIPEATENFDIVLNSIEAIWANSESAVRARSLWYNEAEKDFKGEPYERIMAYYYRGLLYLAKDDFENASASFKGGLVQDAFAEEEQNRSNFALLMFLDGWAHQCRGNYKDATEHYDEARKFRPDFQFPKPGENVLVILETGKSPRKISDGIGHGELKFRRGRNFSEARAEIVSGQPAIELYPMEDIFLKASTRGGRPIDAIIQGKVAFRQNTEQIGTVLSDVSRVAILTSPAFSGGAGGALGAAGAGIGVASAVSLAIAANTGTQADTRYWGGLPDAVHVKTLASLPAGPLSAVYLDDKRVPAEGPEIQNSVRQFGGRCKLVWGRSRRPEPAPPQPK